MSNEESLIKKAYKLKREGNLDEAAGLYYQIIKKNPCLDWAYVNLGEVLASQGNIDKAVANLRKAVDINPDSAWNYYKLGQVLVQQKKEDEAIAYLHQAINIKPEQYRLHKVLGQIFLQNGRLEEALNEFEKAIKINPNSCQNDSQTLRELSFKLKLGDSISYWENRYKKGGNSGAGSFNDLAKYKARVLNDLVARENINTIIDFGCGDGNQLRLAKYPNYMGLDVSRTAIMKCHEGFKNDSTKSFYLYDPLSFFNNNKFFTADLTMSVDVLYHLIEDEIYLKYLNDLFACANKIVAIYSWNFSDSEDRFALHIRPRTFTKDIDKYIKGWRLKEKLDNPYPVEKYGTKDGSYSDFYIYCKADY
jgi:tetratricopeptide (TPR) repeat protein